MQSIKLPGLVLGLAVILTATAVCAQTNASSPVSKSADTNSDERMDQAEFNQYIKQLTFEKLDTNKDGMISLEEWKVVDHSPDAEKHFKAMDKDGDGKLNYQEFSNAPNWKSALKRPFTALNQDRDGNPASDESTRHPRFRLLSVDF